jgi:alpha 1,2-mannosyltransferase
MLLSASRFTRSPLILCLVAFTSLFLLWNVFERSSSLSPSFSGPNSATPAPLLEKQRAFWQSFSPNLLKYGPQCEPIIHYEGGDLSIGYNPTEHSALRPDHLNANDNQLDNLRNEHAEFKAHLLEQNYSLPTVAKSRGVVTTAGGKYLPVAVVSIRMLRETGSSLPVEVFLATHEEWDFQICDVVFSQLNARCVVLSDIFNPYGRKESVEIDKYQYKIMSIVFSTFEEVLFLDADAFPIFDPELYFDSEPFLSTGLVRWPDFWFPSESPLFFQIAGIAEPTVWEKSATESGELYYSKKRHTNSLLLALYYNFYGPDFYYPLQSQGAPGEGDKETFLWAAVVFDEPFYTVKKKVRAVGYNTKSGDWRGSAMVQFDPAEDLKLQSSDNPAMTEVGNELIRPLFLHANFPKFNPGTIFEDVSFGASGPTKDSDGTMRQVWFDDRETSVNFFGFDLERRLWSVIREVACEYEGKFDSWEGLVDVCLKATTYWNLALG